MDRDIEALARYPMESDDWVETVVIGGIASLLAFLIVPYFAVTGYLVRALRAGMEGAEEPPVFDEWGDLLKEGLVAFAIGTIYQIIPIIVFMVTVGGAVISMASGTEAGAAGGLAALVGGMFISWILAIVFGYIGLAGIINYAREGEFSAGFDFGLIGDVIFARSYVFAWLWAIAIQIVVGFVIGVLNIIPFLGSIVGAFVSFYALVIMGWLWGDGFADATRDREEPTPGAVSGSN